MRIDGKYHERVPDDVVENVKFRRRLMKDASGDRMLQASLMAACAVDPVFFIKVFGMQYNPDEIGDEVGPFIPWEFQVRAIVGGFDENGERVYGVLESVLDREDVRWQKSREVGATYIVLYCMLWLVLFHRNKSGMVMSRDIDSVDKADDPSCLFWKLDFILRYLPSWMRGEVVRRKMSLVFKSTEGQIIGEASTEKAGVSGRVTMMLLDEFGQMDYDRDIFGMTRDTCKARVFVFTHKNTSSMAYELCFNPEYSSQREIISHWSQHPKKNRGLYKVEDNKVEVLDKGYEYAAGFRFVMDGKPHGGPFVGIRSPWYDKECVARADETFIAMNLDIDPKGSSVEFFKAHVINDLKRKSRPPVWRGEIEYDRKTGDPIRLYQTANGPLSLWVHPESENFIGKIRSAGGTDLGGGVGASPTCLAIANALTGQKVLEYVSRDVDAIEFAYAAKAMCLCFRDEFGDGAKLAWELQGPGVPFGRRLVDVLGYTNVYMGGDELHPKFKRSARKTYGWCVNQQAKLTLLTSYRDALREGRYENPSYYALDECLCFVYSGKGVTYQRRGKRLANEQVSGDDHHGDPVIADALCWMMISKTVEERELSVASTSYESAIREMRTMKWRLENRREEAIEWL